MGKKGSGEKPCELAKDASQVRKSALKRPATQLSMSKKQEARVTFDPSIQSHQTRTKPKKPEGAEPAAKASALKRMCFIENKLELENIVKWQLTDWHTLSLH